MASRQLLSSTMGVCLVRSFVRTRQWLSFWHSPWCLELRNGLVVNESVAWNVSTKVTRRNIVIDWAGFCFADGLWWLVVQLLQQTELSIDSHNRTENDMPMLIFSLFFEKKEFAWCWCLESRFFPSQSSASDNVFSHLSATVVLSRKEFEFWEIFLTFKIQNLITFQNLNAANFTLRFPFARSSWRKVEVDWIMAIGPYNLHPLHPWASCHFGIHCQNYGICYSNSQSLSQRSSS